MSKSSEIEYGSPAAIFQRAGGLAATGHMAGALTEVVASFGLVGVAASSLVKGLIELPSRFRAAVEAFRPDVVKKLDIATRDFTAVIGRSFVPVIELATRVVRDMGGMLKGVLAALKPFIETVVKAFTALFVVAGEAMQKFMKDGLSPWLPVLEQIGKVAEAVAPLLGDVAAAVGEVVGAVSGVVAAVVGPLVTVVAAVVPLFGTVVKLVSGLIKVIVLPLKLLAAVVGPLVRMALAPLVSILRGLEQILSPVILLVTELASAFSEAAGEVISLVGDILSAFADVTAEVSSLIFELLPPIRDFIQMVVYGAVNAIRKWTASVRAFMDGVRDFMGIERKGGVESLSNRGEAARSANFTSAEEAWKRIVESTASSGRGAAVSAQEKTATATQNLWRWFDQNKDKIGRFLDRADTAGNGTGKVVTGAANVLAPIPSFILDAFRSTVLR